MNLSAVERIAKAVLYEGYMLYPYRPSSVKNRQRWNFGVLFPESYSDSQNGTDRCCSQTECLVSAGPDLKLEVRVRFLRMVTRSIGKLKSPMPDLTESGELECENVEHLEVSGQVSHPWQEAEECEVALNLSHEELTKAIAHPFGFPEAKQSEPARDDNGNVVALIVRKHESLNGVIEVSALPGLGDALKIRILVRNLTPLDTALDSARDEALPHSLLSAHVVLSVTGGKFISLLDPPEVLRALAATCENIGTWPVLVGEPGECDTVLSSPIILYDYPQIAPESAGDLFDGTEIDEILSLRIMTLTEEEKREMRESDERARQILERTDALPPEQFMKLHGVVRALRPVDQEAS